MNSTIQLPSIPRVIKLFKRQNGTEPWMNEPLIYVLNEFAKRDELGVELTPAEFVWTLRSALETYAQRLSSLWLMGFREAQPQFMRLFCKTVARGEAQDELLARLRSL